MMVHYMSIPLKTASRFSVGPICHHFIDIIPLDSDDKGDDVFIFSSRFRTEKAKNENVNGEHIDVHSSKENSSIDICTDSTGCFHTNPVSFDNPVSPVSVSGCVSDIGGDENETSKTSNSPVIPEKITHHPLFGCKSKCIQMKTNEKMKPGQAGTTLPLSGETRYGKTVEEDLFRFDPFRMRVREGIRKGVRPVTEIPVLRSSVRNFEGDESGFEFSIGGN